MRRRMAEAREQINPRVNVSTKALLATYCQEKKATQGDVVEAAILAFLQPPAPGKDGPRVAEPLHALAQLEVLRGIEARLHGLENMLRILEEKREGQAQQLLDKQGVLEGGIAAMIPLLTTIVEKLETPPEPKEPPVPIATYQGVYKEFQLPAAAPEGAEQAEDPEDVIEVVPENLGAAGAETSEPARQGWGRFFSRKATS